MSSKIGDIKVWNGKEYIKTLNGWRAFSQKRKAAMKLQPAERGSSLDVLKSFLEAHDEDFNAIPEHELPYEEYKKLDREGRFKLLEEMKFTGCVEFTSFYDKGEPYVLYPVDFDYIEVFVNDEERARPGGDRLAMNDREDLHWVAAGSPYNYLFYWVKAKKYLKEMCYQIGLMYLENGRVKIK